jgi:lactate permease
MGQARQLARRLPLLATVALLAGGGALAAVYCGDASVAGLSGGLVVLAALTLMGTRHWRIDFQLWRDMAPLLVLVVCLFAVNLIGPLRTAAITTWPAAVSIVPGHEIRFQPLFSAYTYIFLAYLVAVGLCRERHLIKSTFYATSCRVWKPVLAMALFGATGQMVAFSGYSTGFAGVDPTHNIALTLANGVVDFSGRYYPLLAPLIGWVGTFLTGYGTASIVLFGKLHVTTAELLGVSPSLLAAGMAVGSAVGSISSPLKIALAAPMCDAQGQEGDILRRTIPLGIAVSLILGLLLWLTLVW